MGGAIVSTLEDTSNKRAKKLCSSIAKHETREIVIQLQRYRKENIKWIFSRE